MYSLAVSQRGPGCLRRQAFRADSTRLNVWAAPGDRGQIKTCINIINAVTKHLEPTYRFLCRLLMLSRAFPFFARKRDNRGWVYAKKNGNQRRHALAVEEISPLRMTVVAGGKITALPQELQNSAQSNTTAWTSPSAAHSSAASTVRSKFNPRSCMPMSGSHPLPWLLGRSSRSGCSSSSSLQPGSTPHTCASRSSGKQASCILHSVYKVCQSVRGSQWKQLSVCKCVCVCGGGGQTGDGREWCQHLIATPIAWT